MNGKRITTKEAARLARVSRQTLQEWIRTGEFRAPALRLVGSKAVRLWNRSDLKRLHAVKAAIYWPSKARRGKKKRGVR